MRRVLGLVLLGLGAFLLIAAVMVRFYAYPNLAVAPIDQNSITELEAESSTIFDTGTLEEVTTDLTIASRTVGDVEASEDAGDDVRVWVSTTTFTTGEGTVVSQSTERSPFEATSGEAINCCGAFDEVAQGDRVEVKREGLIFKFPFNTQQETYQWWDGTLNDTVEAIYQGEDEIEGLKVYVFKTEVPRTQVGTRALPASILGEEGDDEIEAETMYQDTKTMYVEPETGAVLNRTEDVVNSYAVDGEDRITATEATISYTADQVVRNADDQRSNAQSLGLIRGPLPIGLVVAGLVGLLAGLFLVRQPASARKSDEDFEDQ
jgi:hypothetical protein